jgi:hypothetical protein
MRTKFIGILMIVVAVCNILIDVLSGSSSGLNGHFNALILGFNGAGFYFMRDGIQKLTDLLLRLSGFKLSDPKMDTK